MNVTGDRQDDDPVLYCMSCGEGIPRSAAPALGVRAVTYTCPGCGHTMRLAAVGVRGRDESAGGVAGW
jgi:predicted RNA-binding Zn-ribbon protein involved in translation (DUF1610 family)